MAVMVDALRPSETASGDQQRLTALFTGDHAWCADKLMLSANLGDGVPLPDFFAGRAFAEAIDRYAAISNGSDRRAVVSMWSLYYFAGLIIPHLVARRIGRRLLPVSFERMTIALSDNGLPRAFGVPHGGVVEAIPVADDFEAIEPLLETHLFQAVDALKMHGISAKLCWNNAAVYIDYTLRATGAPEMTAARRFDLPLFIRGCLPNGGVNPLSGCIKQVEENGECLTRRKVCCLRYMLPGIPSCGNLCALPEKRGPSAAA